MFHLGMKIHLGAHFAREILSEFFLGSILVLFSNFVAK